MLVCLLDSPKKPKHKAVRDRELSDKSKESCGSVAGIIDPEPLLQAGILSRASKIPKSTVSHSQYSYGIVAIKHAQMVFEIASAHLSTYLFVYLSICLSLCLSVCLSIYPSIYLTSYVTCMYILSFVLCPFESLASPPA